MAHAAPCAGNGNDNSVSVYETPGETQAPGSAGVWQTYPIQETFGEEKPFERNDLFLAEMRHMLQVIQGSAQPACTLEDGIQALCIALAALQSARDGILVDPKTLE